MSDTKPNVAILAAQARQKQVVASQDASAPARLAPSTTMAPPLATAMIKREQADYGHHIKREPVEHGGFTLHGPSMPTPPMTTKSTSTTTTTTTTTLLQAWRTRVTGTTTATPAPPQQRLPRRQYPHPRFTSSARRGSRRPVSRASSARAPSLPAPAKTTISSSGSSRMTPMVAEGPSAVVQANDKNAEQAKHSDRDERMQQDGDGEQKERERSQSPIVIEDDREDEPDASTISPSDDDNIESDYVDAADAGRTTTALAHDDAVGFIRGIPVFAINDDDEDDDEKEGDGGSGDRAGAVRVKKEELGDEDDRRDGQGKGEGGDEGGERETHGDGNGNVAVHIAGDADNSNNSSNDDADDIHATDAANDPSDRDDGTASLMDVSLGGPPIDAHSPPPQTPPPAEEQLIMPLIRVQSINIVQEGVPLPNGLIEWRNINEDEIVTDAFRSRRLAEGARPFNWLERQRNLKRLYVKQLN